MRQFLKRFFPLVALLIVAAAFARQAAPEGPSQDNPPAGADQEKYEAALTDGLMAMADQQWEAALEAFENAQRFNDTEFVQGEIAKLRQRLDQETTAKKTVGDIEKVLDEGNSTEAARLAKLAIREFGDGDASDQLIKLRLQADALQTAAAPEDAADRYQRFRDEGEKAEEEQNLRAAALAYEQAVQARADERLQGRLEELRDKLQKYDSLRRRAAELRRDPQQLDEALEALQEAAKIWDTLQVRQDIDAYNLALQRRRDNLSVAEFEVRGDLGVAEAGRTIAEELMPHFKSKFDLVERGQVDKVIEELKLEGDLGDDAEQQREVSRLAKVRFLVVGSVRAGTNITVSARLVDARTGLIVQTGKVNAATMDDALQALPELAKQLLMNDEEKMAYDQEQARLVKRVEPPADDLPLPPPPDIPEENQAPPPLQLDVAAPPGFDGVPLAAFRRFPPPPAAGVQVVLASPDPVFQRRLLFASLSLGDDLFRRRRFVDARRHFDFALSLSPGNFDLHLRLGRVRPLLPPPVVVVDPVPVVVRQRIAVLDFATYGDPLVVPPGLGPWTASQLAPYFRAGYDVVDPAEIYWWMGRLGISMRDLVDDPNMRRWLGRAAGIRYFVLGTLVETASFDVTTYMLDAEFGYLHSSAGLHVRNAKELKYRLGELAQLTMVDSAERARRLADAERFNALLARGRQSMDRRDFVVAVNVFQDALTLRPGHIEASFYLSNARRQAEIVALEQARRREYLRRQAFAEAAARRQWELARAAELARVRAAQEAALMAEADRRAMQARRLRAQENLLVRARAEVRRNNFVLAFDFFKGAADLAPARGDEFGYTPAPVIYRELAQARAEMERRERLRHAEAEAAREAALRRQREAELARVREQLAREKLALAEAKRKSQDERERMLYQTSFDEGQRLMAQGKYAAAISALQAARRVKSTPVVEAMLNRAIHEQTLASAKSAAERKQFEAKLAAERDRSQQNELAAKAKQKMYETALVSANRALAATEFDAAKLKFEEAGRLFQTDAVLSGLRRVEAARHQAAAKSKATADQSGRIKQLLAEGRTAYEAKQYPQAMKAYLQAKKLAPDNVDVLAGLSQTESAAAKFGADAQRQANDAKRQKEFQRLYQSGQANLKAKQYDAAALALAEALKLNPTDTTTANALKEAQAGQKKAAGTTGAGAELKKKTETYQRLIADGRLALERKQYDSAIKAFGDAQKVLPGDATSAGYLKDAQQAKAAATAQRIETAKKKEDLGRDAEFQRALAAGKRAMETKNYKDAVLAYQRAGKLKPNDAQVSNLLEAAQREQRRVAAATADYDDAIAFGQKALKARRYPDAIRAFQEAGKLLPGDPRAAALLRQAQLAAEDASKTKVDPKKEIEVPKKKIDEPKKKIDEPKKKIDEPKKSTADAQRFQQLLASGQRAMQAKKYEDAVKAFGDANKLIPDDTRASQLLSQAQRLLDDSKKSDPKKPDTKKPSTKKPETKKKVEWTPPAKEWSERTLLLSWADDAETLRATPSQAVGAVWRGRRFGDEALAPNAPGRGFSVRLTRPIRWSRFSVVL